MFLRPKEDWVAIIIVTVFALLIARGCHAAEILEEKAIHAILGEARGEGYAGMYAVACAIRNRGTLSGVWGATADVSDASGEIYQKAAKAWAESEDGPDVTHGATHWENVGAFGRPWWARKMKKTLVVRHHVFFK